MMQHLILFKKNSLESRAKKNLSDFEIFNNHSGNILLKAGDQHAEKNLFSFKNNQEFFENHSGK